MAGKKREDKPIEGTVEIIRLHEEDDPAFCLRQTEYFARIAADIAAEVDGEAATAGAGNHT